MDIKLKKLNFLDTHDLFSIFLKNSDMISKGCQDCIDNRPTEFGTLPFYIFAHARSCDGGMRKRLIWCPRLTKPKAQENSMLFKCYPPDKIKVIWILPQKELWNSYLPKNMMHSPIIWDSIQKFQFKKYLLEAPESDDLSQEKIDNIYTEISRNIKNSSMTTCEKMPIYLPVNNNKKI